MPDETQRELREQVRARYAQAARTVLDRGLRATDSCGGEPVTGGCGAPAAGVQCCGPAGQEEASCFGGPLYADGETDGLPGEAVLASLGCGNPLAVADLREGERVLDLGSGGGIDVLLSARRVGPAGFAYGVDMTDDMLTLARANAARAGARNVQFRKGEIENLPLPDAAVDVVISNCVINLSADKDRVLAEAFRVLKPGGRFAVSDVVVRGQVPADVRRNVELWIGCVAGALEESEYRAKLVKAGFEAIDVEPTRVYRVEDARQLLADAGLNPDAIAADVAGKFMSAFVRAIKPKQARDTETSSCAPSGCR
jgi:arsenite methyltransferase